eukprot:CAMPEP_0118696928 /NCGR_PEP_ID=MMETSP0800-20121206/14166_1 /TAXON_ID=210618 ORGANISM="Striatella unipunctata, Strain CCMP2910" /NCGR_SAMPLE_ID=MMETSP0800 /ASSEMBLY_ACC=CAM_ASM_000638 /LENGTH=236 /DNA_ID=CAMNT_0006596189 /DNA_START=120 /DNA_END=827 /DNA_ORIENTATION=+
MTIKIENHAVLRVLGRDSSSSSQGFDVNSNTQITFDDQTHQEALLLKDDLQSSRGPCEQFACREYQTNSNDSCVENVLIPTVSQDEGDDDCSLSSASTADNSRGSTESSRRRVSFAAELIAGVRTRPRTPPEDLPHLFYTGEETQRFRQEYRLERQLLAQLDSDPSSLTVDVDDLAFLYGDFPQHHQHRISRVVVMHNDTLETYDDDSSFSSDSFPAPQSDAFFDNDSFWSGSITW